MQTSSSENLARPSRGSYAMQEEVRKRMVGSSTALDWPLRQGPILNESGYLVESVGTTMDITERKVAEELRAEKAREVALRADVSVSFSKTDLREMLRDCTEAMVRHLDAAFARIWTVDKNGQMLELQASAGMYTHLNGAHSLIPIGKLKIGLIAEEKKPHLTNDVLNDPRISDKA